MIVYYDFYSEKHPSIALLGNEPIAALKEAEKGEHLHCPAVQNYYMNAFNIHSPFSAEIQLNQNNVHFVGDDVGIDAVGCGEHYLVQLMPSIIFRCEQSLMLEIIPPALQKARCDLTYIGGCYDIGKWIRPIQATWLIKSNTKIYHDEVLTGVRFLSNESVRLERKLLTDNELKMTKACMNITRLKHAGNNLDDLYKRFLTTKELYARKT